MHRDRHPGRQHEPQASTRSGASSPSPDPATCAGRRPSRPARTTTPRTSTPTATSPRRPRPSGRKGQYALAVGAWNGNSDNSVVGQVFSIDVTTYVWQGFMQEATKSWKVTDFKQPRRARPGQDRPLHRAQAAGRRPLDRRVVHRRHRARGHARRGRMRPGRPRLAERPRAQLPELDGGRPRLAEPGEARARRVRRRQQDPDGVLLQRPVPAVRAVVGRARRGPRLRRPEPVRDLLPGPDSGSEQRPRAVVRRSVGRSVREPRVRAVPDADPVRERAAEQ